MSKKLYRLPAVMIMLALLLAQSQPVLACSCVPYPPPLVASFHNADAVFVGTVNALIDVPYISQLAQLWPDLYGGLGSSRHVFFEVSDSWKASLRPVSQCGPGMALATAVTFSLSVASIWFMLIKGDTDLGPEFALERRKLHRQLKI